MLVPTNSPLEPQSQSFNAAIKSATEEESKLKRAFEELKGNLSLTENSHSLVNKKIAAIERPQLEEIESIAFDILTSLNNNQSLLELESAAVQFSEVYGLLTQANKDRLTEFSLMFNTLNKLNIPFSFKELTYSEDKRIEAFKYCIEPFKKPWRILLPCYTKQS